jgi:aminomethyltransferase
MSLKTALFDLHLEAGANMVPFGGWDMPLHYGSQLNEHHQVRGSAGMFDVSHMLVVDISGERSREFLRKLLANDVAKLKVEGSALYSCMLNPQGGVVDDLIVYLRGDGSFRLVVNAGTATTDLAWIEQQATTFGCIIEPRRDLAMIAVQGPQAREMSISLLPQSLQVVASEIKPFASVEAEGWFVARTGYTGEDGFEIMLPATEAAGLWRSLLTAGVSPCGLGARDTLRLEAGMNLYGSDMDEGVSPLEAGLGWTIAWEPQEREFIGREPLELQRDRDDNLLFVGLVLLGRGVLRDHLKLFQGEREVGEITSGGYAPTLGKSIALARIAPGDGGEYEVELRGKRLPVRVVQPPFVRNGKSRI